MKRPPPEETNHPLKRNKLINEAETLFSDKSLQKSPTDIFRSGTDGTGYFSGHFKMTWPPTAGKRMAIIEIVDGNGPKIRFNVSFEGICARYFDQLIFSSHDPLWLSLKGAEVEKLAKPPATGTLAMCLRYTSGVLIRFRHKGEIHDVDIWKLQQTETQIKDDWFSTPTPVPEAVQMLLVPPAETPLETPRDSIAFKSGSAIIQVDPPAPNKPAHTPTVSTSNLNVPLTKKQAKKLRRMEREKARQEATKESSSVPISSATTNDMNIDRGKSNLTIDFNIAQPQPITINISDTSSTLIQHSEAFPDGDTSMMDGSGDLAGSPGMQAGFRATETGDGYLAIDKITTAGQQINLVGVVISSTSRTRTRNGDWTCKVVLTDPSRSYGFPINCFTKKYEQWLPKVEPGDILIARAVKTVSFGSNIIGTGYYDKLKWAIYDPKSGLVHHGDKRDAPETEGLVDGFGHLFSPFFTPKKSEIAYCVKLSDWWQETQKKDHEGADNVYLIGNDSYRRPGRQHHDLKELGVIVLPGTYFDCTVEVLSGHPNNNGVFSLYVTDYTTNKQFNPTGYEKQALAPPDSTMRIELWDASALLGPGMEIPGYYSIRNARVTDKNGFVEAKVQEQKIRKLDPQSDPTDLHLTALLSRKKDWEGDEPKGSPFEHRLIADVEESQFFNCTVEIIHTEYVPMGPSAIYITDYTSHPLLVDSNIEESWATGLKGFVAKIMVWDSQSEMAQFLRTGDYYMIKKLRLRYNIALCQFQGFLGGFEKLIHMLDPENTQNEHLVALIKRKEEWKNAIEKRVYGKIKDIEAHTAYPASFTVIARVVNYEPRDLKSCSIVYCSMCKKIVPPLQRACFDCGDTEFEFVRHRLQLFLELEDDNKSRIIVSVNDECPLFNGLKRGYFRYSDPALYQLFCKRVEPLLGDLMPGNDLDEGATKTPFLKLVVNRWKSSSGMTAYGLEDFDGLEAEK